MYFSIQAFTMYTARNVLFGLIAAAAGVSAADAASDVTQLNKDTFNDFVKGNELVLAECTLPSQ